MINIVIASDSFKGSASSSLVADSIAKGIMNVSEEVNIDKYSIADGGEGTVEAVIEMVGGTYHYEMVTDPYGGKVKARYGMIDHHTAIVEMAEANGLQFKQMNSNPSISSSYGTGELMLAAINKGANHIYLGLGGSATIDGGIGMIQALGVKLLDKQGLPIGSGIEALRHLDRIDTRSIDPRVNQCQWTVLSDVTNPLTGPSGSIAVFGSQKGVEEAKSIFYDSLLSRFAEKVNNGLYFKEVPGAGAAGGLGFALLAFCGAHLKSGIQEMIRLIGLEKAIEQADLVVTGEGKMDGQSVHGKAPIGIAKLAKKYQVPVVAVVGGRESNLSVIYESGIDLVIDIITRPILLKEAMENVEELLIEAGESVYRAYRLGN